MAHARLSASAAHRWMECPGSVRLSEGLNTASPEAAAGTFAHHIAAECIQSGGDPSDWLGNRTIVDGFTVECDGEMVEAVRAYVEYARRFQGATSVELDVTAALQSIDPDLGGTADLTNAEGAVLDIADFKFGAGVFVSAEDNRQLKLYALGVLLAMNRGFDTVRTTVVQPRIDGVEPIRTWEWPVGDIIDFAAEVADAAAATKKPDAPLVPGPKQCKFCPARATCPELEKQQHALTALDFQNVQVYDPVSIGRMLDVLPMVKARIKALEQLGYTMAKQGTPPAGHKLVAKRAIRKWTPDALAQAQVTWPAEWFAPAEPLSVAQLEKKLGKKEFAKAVAAEAITQQSSGYTLVPESDARPAATVVSADDFDVITGASINE